MYAVRGHGSYFALPETRGFATRNGRSGAGLRGVKSGTEALPFERRVGTVAPMATRTFIVSPGPTLTRISKEQWARLCGGHTRIPKLAGQELKLLIVGVDEDERTVRRVLSLWPFRMWVTPYGWVDVESYWRQLEQNERNAAGRKDPIESLEFMANMSWTLDDDIRAALAKRLKRPVSEIVLAERSDKNARGDVIRDVACMIAIPLVVYVRDHRDPRDDPDDDDPDDDPDVEHADL